MEGNPTFLNFRRVRLSDCMPSSARYSNCENHFPDLSDLSAAKEFVSPCIADQNSSPIDFPVEWEPHRRLDLNCSEHQKSDLPALSGYLYGRYNRRDLERESCRA